jgi:phage tail sheath protein FI
MSQINESTITTPGVYVNEIPSFPPSIAQVATAIPAFIGYTADATNLQPGDLIQVPTRLSSLVEYQQYFGNGPDPGIIEVDIDANNVVTNVKRNATYYMYDSVRMFFLNGGGACYIVSIGLFSSSPTFSATDFTTGLTAAGRYDEPTLLLFPDAVQLSAPDRTGFAY